MATADNLRLMDIDEHLRPAHESCCSPLLALAQKLGFTVDLATSDVSLYLQNVEEEHIPAILALFPGIGDDYAYYKSAKELEL